LPFPHFCFSANAQLAHWFCPYAQVRPFSKTKEPIFPLHLNNYVVSLQTVRKLKSILLLFIMGMTLFPWQSVCVNHPLGHEDHEHDDPSTCELHKMAAKQGGEHILPPMDCKYIAAEIDDFNQPQDKVVIISTVQLTAVVTVLLDLVSLGFPEQIFLLPPEPNCRSATLLSDSPLRAPPLV
jgi:hypothetical protein